MKRLKIFNRIFLISFSLSIFACTDLEEDLFSEVTADNFFQSEEQFISALGAAYSSLSNYGSHNSYWSLQEVSTDEAIIPQRGADWFDGGQWIRVHRHEYTAGEQSVNNAWNTWFGGINNCNRLIFQFETLEAEGSDAFIAELRALRALYYYFLLDLYGNVPIVTDFDVPQDFLPSNNSDPAAGRQEVFNFIESELLATIPLLDDATGQATYARVNRWTAQTLLAKLYLNAEVYTGTARWQDCIDQCDDVINSGNYSLTANFFDNFVTNNSNSPEHIFVVPYDEVFVGGFNIHQMTLHYNSQSTFNLQEQPWNGYATLQEFYNSFEDQDVRKEGLLEGPQETATGDPVLDPSVESADPDGPQLNFTPEINELEPNALRQAGVRFNKFEYANGATANLSNDFPILRYADVILMKAEALANLNGYGDVTALALVNQIRERAGVDPFLSLDADKLLAERGREFYTEAWRRSDLIRFGKYNDPWQFKPASAPEKNVMPLPSPQLDNNSNLNQNPSY